MRKSFLILTITVLTTIILAACSAQPTQTDDMSSKDMASEKMEGEPDGTMAEESSVMADKTSASMDSKSMDDDTTTDGDDKMTDHNEDAATDDDSMQSDDQMMNDDDSETMAEGSSDMMIPDWFSVPLTNARNGETFTIADFKGKVILVETLAMWCSNCLKQQQQVYDLHQILDSEDFISVGIDIDSNENVEALEAYIINNGFNWYYAVAPEHVAREIGNLYGSQFLNPPSTPMFIIDRQGEVHPLPFGIKDAASLLEALQPFLDESM